MSTTLAVTFPWGLYHATPWARNVNEGAVEWPPSPWRLLRTLFATWKARAPHLDDAMVHGLLEDLSALPSYTIPTFAEAHTRHYMPDKDHKLGLAGRTDKVIDAFVVTSRDAAVAITWDVDLSEGRRNALEELAELVPYLGRAESVCVMRLASPGESFEGQTCEPAVEPTNEAPPTRLLTPSRPLDLAALTMRTTEVRKRGLLQPPGTAWIDYSPVIADAPVASSPRRRAPRPTAVRWSVVSKAPPSIYTAVAMADALRSASMGSYGELFSGDASVLLAGKGPNGVPLRGHRHAHYFAADLDGDRLIDTLVLWAPDGLDHNDLCALDRIRELRGRSFVGLRPCRLGLEALGPVDVVVPELARSDTTWVSHTPFAPARHGRRSTEWFEHVADEIARELEYRGFAQPTSIELQAGGWLDFRRRRLRERLDDSRRAIGVKVTFPIPIAGPIALGALSHFGLGLFVPGECRHPA